VAVPAPAAGGRRRAVAVPPLPLRGLQRHSNSSPLGSSPDFERTAGPMDCSAYGDSGGSTLPITASLSYRDPGREVLLRIECPADREMQVRRRSAGLNACVG